VVVFDLLYSFVVVIVAAVVETLRVEANDKGTRSSTTTADRYVDIFMKEHGCTAR